MKTMMFVELGHEYVKIALTGHDKTTFYSKERFVAPVSDGEIIDWDETARIFADYIRLMNVYGCNVKIVLHHPQAAMRFEAFPKMRASELDKVLRYRMPEMFPGEGKGFVYSYRICGLDNGMTKAAVVRLPLEISQSCEKFFCSLGLNPVLLDSYVNAVSLYLERHFDNRFVAIYEHSDRIGIIDFSDGKPVLVRDIFFSDRDYAVHETQKYLRTFTQLDNIFLLTERGIINESIASGINKSITPIADIEKYPAFYGIRR